jgi:hypothetical protein
LRDDTARVLLACRNDGRAHAARTDLEAATGRSIFEVVIVDVTDLKSVGGPRCTEHYPPQTRARSSTCPLLACRIATFAVTGTPPTNGPPE